MMASGESMAYVAGREASNLPKGPVVHRPSTAKHGIDWDAALSTKTRVGSVNVTPSAPATAAGSEGHPKAASSPAGGPAEHVAQRASCAPDTLPSYALKIAAVMANSEGHPEPAVRVARKEVVAALQRLHKALHPQPAAPPPAKSVGRVVPSRQIRAWARAAGYDCPARGRIPERVLRAYAAAHGRPR